MRPPSILPLPLSLFHSLFRNSQLTVNYYQSLATCVAFSQPFPLLRSFFPVVLSPSNPRVSRLTNRVLPLPSSVSRFPRYFPTCLFLPFRSLRARLSYTADGRKIKTKSRVSAQLHLALVQIYPRESQKNVPRNVRKDPCILSSSDTFYRWNNFIFFFSLPLPLVLHFYYRVSRGEMLFKEKLMDRGWVTKCNFGCQSVIWQ